MDFITFSKNSTSNNSSILEATLSTNSDDSQVNYYEMIKNTNELWTPYTKYVQIKIDVFRFRAINSKIEQLPCSVMNAPFLLGESNFDATLEADSWSFESASQADSDTFSDVSMIDSSDDEALEQGEGTGQGLHNRKLHTLQGWSADSTDKILCSSLNALQHTRFDRNLTSIISDESRIDANFKSEKPGFRDCYPVVHTVGRRDGF